MKPLNDSDLDQLLKKVGASTPTPPAFQRDVWRLIEATGAGDRKARVWQIVECSFACLALPRMAIATCTAVALAGAWVGTKAAAPGATNEVSYVQSISPFARINH